ncbi:carboxymuconolactone decarboxylase family protein [Actinospica robiniae]|uniref:Alkylhydroperoxidase AhpD family core domain n=1 Tax=Actinospica robiniae DSM 44927 TaxID=479430 RepID=W9E4F0_9ACTN|nr:carboxymuconolactone decarboxylase family protein [Actinospica robiniae]ETA71027.1 alkylhydroperoxidase AhpD family core domain [Actinospica robiniae DSM 44927]
MQARMETTVNPDVVNAIQLLSKAVRSSGIDQKTTELVHLRVSQINGCSPCVYAGVAQAKKLGETDERLHAVAVWRESPFFTDAERAALDLAEAATRIEDGQPGVDDETWQAAAEHFAPAEISSILLCVALTNFFNRINRALRTPAGKVW